MAGETKEDAQTLNHQKTRGINGVNDNSAKKTAQKQDSYCNDWNYNESDVKNGPKNWVKAFAPMNCGQRQSPIQVELECLDRIPLSHEPFRLVKYNSKLCGELENTGRSIQFSPETAIEPPEISGGMLDQSYRFVQYHFHWGQNDNEGSEHILNGVRYPAELHMVHKGIQDPSKLAVLGVFLKICDENGGMAFGDEEFYAFQSVLKYPLKSSLTLSNGLIAKLPRNRVSPSNGNSLEPNDYLFGAPFIRYCGSLTTPPCTENVTWTVFADPIAITKEQMKLLRSVEDSSGSVQRNYRPVQNCNDRAIFLCC